MKLNFTKDEVYADFEDAPVSYEQKLQQDWLTLHNELFTARQTIQKLIKAGNKLYHDLYAMRTHKGYEPFTCETRWDELMEKMRNETEL